MTPQKVLADINPASQILHRNMLTLSGSNTVAISTKYLGKKNYLYTCSQIPT